MLIRQFYLEENYGRIKKEPGRIYERRRIQNRRNWTCLGLKYGHFESSIQWMSDEIRDSAERRSDVDLRDDG